MRQHPTKHARRFFGVVLAGGLVIAACGSDSAGRSTTAQNTESSVATTSGGSEATTAGDTTPETTPSTDTTERGDVLTLAQQLAPSTLNPALANSDPNHFNIMALAYEPMVRLNPDLTYSPGLAEKWEFDAENKNFTLTLREGLKFSDGTPLTATEAVASINYFLKTSASTPVFGSTISGVEATDDRTIVVSQSTSNPTLPRYFSENFYAGSVISPDAVADPTLLDGASHGAGPYVLDTADTVSGSTYVYTPNDNFYDQSLIHWNKIVVKVIADTAATVQAVQTGQVDVAFSTDGTIVDAAKAAGITTSVGAPVANFGVLLADRDGEVAPELKDPKVRQALIQAVDNKAVCNAAFGPVGGVASANWPTLDANDPTIDSIYPYDVDKAKSLLAEAGFPDGFKIKLEMPAFPPFVTVGQAVAGLWKEIGVEAEITTHPGVTESQTAQASKEFPTYVWGYGRLPAQLTAGSFLSGAPGAFNAWGTTDPDITSLIEAAPALPADEASAKYTEAFTDAYKLGWSVNICELESITVGGDRSTGWELENADTIPFATIFKPT
jgi:peptide/nickel transport system substrate-binding protein